MIHAKEVLAVADSHPFTDAAKLAGRKSGDAVAHLVARFNVEGLPALETRHRGGPPLRYTSVECERILREFRRAPDRRLDGTATWELSTLQRALRRAADGFPKVSTYTILCTLHEAGPYQTIPYPGHHWQPEGEPSKQPHEYAKNGTAKLLTLFHPATGKVRVKGVTTCPNTVLHEWLQEELTHILALLPASSELNSEDNRAQWQRWQEGLQIAPSIGDDMPPLRLLLVLDNLSGHHTPSFVMWLCEHGIMPLYTPLGGSWLNMSESRKPHHRATSLRRRASHHSTTNH